jgi:RimJ/RimL family protein N-acetyltransferase
MRLALKRCVIRKWRLDDATALAQQANNRNVWLGLRDLFPHPYTMADAETYLNHVILERPAISFCIDIDNVAVGGIGIRIGHDVHKYTAELGYWLGEQFWGRGVMGEAVNAFTHFCFNNFPLHRIYAEPYSNNPASVRVLEKAGFVLEGRLKENVVKDGKRLDSLLYARTEETFLIAEIPRDDEELVDLPPDPAAAIIVAGSGRSGTTWLSQIINYGNEYRDMFEPFEPHQVPRVSHFRRNQYLRPTNGDYHYVEPVRQILSGQIRSEWIDQFNRCRVASRRLIKDIRCSLFLKWLATHFPETPIVYLLRHPLAVVRSRMQLHWHARLHDFLEQRELIEDHLQPFVSEIERANELPECAFERQVLFWCVENYVPLSQFQRSEICLISYERLCLEPEAEVQRIFAFLNKTYDRRALEQRSRPSAQTRPASPIMTGGDLLEGWQNSFSSAQIDFAIGMLRRFGLDRVYGRDPLPVGGADFT